MKETKKKGFVRCKIKNNEQVIFLETLKKKKLYELRRLEWKEDPMEDPELLELLDRCIELEGVKQKKTVLMTSWNLII